MFFALSKVLWWFLAPAKVALVAAGIGLAATATRFARFGRWLLAGGVVALILMGLTPLGVLMLQPLEDRFPPPPDDMAAPDAIIVLGGAMNEDMKHARGPTSMTEAGVRMTAGLELARRYPQARLVFTGGSASLTPNGDSEANGAERLWLALGAPKDRMNFERRSRNTHENAAFTKDMLQPKPGERFLLVTSAWHMPRSMGIFRRQGFNVTAYPVDYQTYPGLRGYTVRQGTIERLKQFEWALREWIGLIAYRFTDKTDALFPTP